MHTKIVVKVSAKLGFSVTGEGGGGLRTKWDFIDTFPKEGIKKSWLCMGHNIRFWFMKQHSGLNGMADFDILCNNLT